MAEKESDLLNDVYREIGEKLGLDTAINIYQMYKGQQITFPVHLFNAKRIQHSIIGEYDTSIGFEIGYSAKTVRRIGS